MANKFWLILLCNFRNATVCSHREREREREGEPMYTVWVVLSGQKPSSEKDAGRGQNPAYLSES